MIKLYLKKIFNFLRCKYKCPICGSPIHKFVSLNDICGGKFTQDVLVNSTYHSVLNYETLNVDSFLCPVCGAQDKARLYALYIKTRLKRKTNFIIKLLHFAPEGGLPDLIRKIKYIEYITADLFRDDVDEKADLTNLKNYEDDSIDIFICSHILEHIKNDNKAFLELYRILKPGGWGIIMVPILLSIEETYEDRSIVTESERLLHFGLEDHLRIYSKKNFLEKLLDVGFNVKQLDVSFFSKRKFIKNGIDEKSVLYIVEK